MLFLYGNRTWDLGFHLLLDFEDCSLDLFTVVLTFCVNHGLAVERGEFHFAKDELRPLTPKGRRQLRKITAAMRRMEVSFDVILSSPLVRARQTAEIVATELKMPKRLSFTAELKPGDLLPDYELTSEAGGKIHISDFRGRVLAFTFFFTRCPLPDFCPRMGNNFAKARELLLTQSHAPTNWGKRSGLFQILLGFSSIIFPPDF